MSELTAMTNNHPEQVIVKYKKGKRDARNPHTFEDVVDANKALKNAEEVYEVWIIRNGMNFTVDLKTGEITANNQIVDLHLPPGFKPKKLRWINFRRCRVSMVHPDGEHELANPTHLNVIGWQTTHKGKNIQRMLAIDDNGAWQLWTQP